MSYALDIEKQDFFKKLYESGALVYVLIDSTRPDVIVPGGRSPMFTLHYGLRAPLPIQDLEIAVGELRGTMAHSNFKTRVPWSAVWSIYSPAIAEKIWIESMPESVRQRREARELRLQLYPTRRLVPAGWNVIIGGRK